MPFAILTMQYDGAERKSVLANPLLRLVGMLPRSRYGAPTADFSRAPPSQPKGTFRNWTASSSTPSYGVDVSGEIGCRVSGWVRGG
jgi:hypothetical protein